MVDDSKNCCRICLDVKRERISVLQDPIIHLQMKTCLSIVVMPYDPLPKSICISCVSQLNDYYNFVVNARCSQDWLEETHKKSSESKPVIQPLPDSEYNSDSLLEFLNNTSNIEEYLNNLGKEDIPSIVNILDRNQERQAEANQKSDTKKNANTKKKATPLKKTRNNFEIDVLDSDIDIVNEILIKETDPKTKTQQDKQVDKNAIMCFACKIHFNTKHKLSQHLSVCDYALRTCIHCNCIFDSKKQMLQHYVTHSTPLPITCNCSEKFDSNEKWLQHSKLCHSYLEATNCVYRCKQCGVVFKDRLQLYQHANEHVKKEKIKDCDICSHSFPGEKALIKHKKEVHKVDANQKYRCKICQFTSGDRKEVYLHVKKHLAKKPIRHLCESCGQSFTTNSALIKHSSKHTGKPYRCSICKKKFKDSYEKDAHMLDHENFMCDKCGRTVRLLEHTCEVSDISDKLKIG